MIPKLRRMGYSNAGVAEYPGGEIILISYRTPIAVRDSNGQIYVTGNIREIYSASTQRHLHNWLRAMGYPNVTEETSYYIKTRAAYIVSDYANGGLGGDPNMPNFASRQSEENPNMTLHPRHRVSRGWQRNAW